MTRMYRQPHEAFLAEWLGISYPPGTWSTNVRLGKVTGTGIERLSPEERRMLQGAFGAQADAVVVLKDKVVIVEAMIRHEPGALEDLIKYEMLFKETEEYKTSWGKPIEKILLTPLDLPFHVKLAKSFGVRVVQYKPLWIMDYLSTLPHRHQTGRLGAIHYPEKRK